MPRTSIRIIGHVLTVALIVVLAYYRLVDHAVPLTFLLSLAYAILLWQDRKAGYLYPGALLFSASYLLGLSLVTSPVFYLLGGLPLVLLLHGLATHLRRASLGGYSTPLNGAGYASAIFLAVVTLYPGLLAQVNMAIPAALIGYSVLYVILSRLHRNPWLLLPSGLSFALMAYFALGMVPGMTPALRLAYHIGISPVYVGIGFLLRRADRRAAHALYTAAGVIALLEEGVVVITGNVVAGRIVLLAGAITYALLAILVRREEFIYLITLSLGLLAYHFTQISADSFFREVLYFFLGGLILVSLIFLYALIRRNLRYVQPLSFLIARNWKGVLAFSLPVLALVPLLTIGYGIEVSESPYFCGTCHKAEPLFRAQYESWERSSHKDVKCIDCHYPPGVRGLVQGKIDGLRHTMLFATRSFSLKEHDEIDDRNCLRSGCHTQDALYGKPGRFKGKIKYDHQPHLSSSVNGMELRCTTCHSHYKEGPHFEVRGMVCSQCHLNPARGEPAALSQCSTCHDPPEQTLESAFGSYNHVDFLEGKDGVRCSDCHDEVTRGTGAVLQEKCLSCHDHISEKISDRPYMHTVHVTRHRVECFECHGDIQHGIRREVPGDMVQGHFEGACSRCHGDQHAAPRQIYAGVGGQGIQGEPSPMFATNVDCVGCHRGPQAEAEGSSEVGKADKAACDTCHGPGEGYGDMVDEWQNETRAAMAGAKAALERIQQRIAQSERQGEKEAYRQAAQRLYERARLNYDLVVSDGSLGVHNYDYVGRILKQVRADCEQGLGLFAEERPTVSVR